MYGFEALRLDQSEALVPLILTDFIGTETSNSLPQSPLMCHLTLLSTNLSRVSGLQIIISLSTLHKSLIQR